MVVGVSWSGVAWVLPALGSYSSLREPWMPTCTVTYWSRPWSPPFRDRAARAVFQHYNDPQTHLQDDHCLLKKLRVKVICGASSNGRWTRIYIYVYIFIWLNLTGAGVLLQETLLSGICQKRQQISSTNATHQTIVNYCLQPILLAFMSSTSFLFFMKLFVTSWMILPSKIYWIMKTCFGFSSLEKHASINP